MKRLQSRYWLDNQDVINLGDYITELLLQALGYKFVRYPHPEAANQGECLFCIGTTLCSRWIRDIPTPDRVVIWGAGYWGDEQVKALLPRLDIRMVRGPITRQFVGKDVPIGDPGLLLPLFFPASALRNQKVLAVPHCNNLAAYAKKERSLPGGTEICSCMVKKSNWWERAGMILAAEFVITNSLHTAILRQAYGLPWAFWLHRQDSWDKPVKWYDWFGSLGLPAPQPSRDLDGCRRWWETVGKFGQSPPLEPMLKVFPYPRNW
jgi:hypothetical protein